MLRNDLNAEQRNKLIGEVVSLMLCSQVHRDFSIGNISDLIYPAIEHRNFSLFYDNNKVVGYCSWAFMAADIAEKFLLGKLIPNLEHWHSGKQLVMVDFIAPFGHAKSFIKKLRKQHKGKFAIAARFKTQGKLLGLRKYHGY